MSSFASQNARILAPLSPTRTALSTSSTAAVSAGNAGEVICFLSDADVHIVFGTSAVAAADTDSIKLRAGVIYPFTLDASRTHFRAILASGSSEMWHFVGSA